MTNETCKDLTVWFLDQLPGKVNHQAGSFSKQVKIASTLVGTKDRPGKYTVREVKRALRAFKQKNQGRLPTNLGVLDSSTWFAPTGQTWVEYANTPPAMPPTYNVIQLSSWMEEWGDTLEIGTRQVLEAYIQKNLLSN